MRSFMHLGPRALAVFGAVMLAGVGIASAQEYPSQPVTMVVPFSAGGAADTTGRILAEAMGGRLGSNVLVENIPGAGGAIGSTRVKDAEPDGYTIGLGHMGTLAASVAVNPELTFDPKSDFDYLGIVSITPSIVFVNKDLPVKDLGEFVAYARDPEHVVTFGNSGIGAASQLACILFFRAIGVEPVEVPYQGFGQTIKDVLSGDIDGSCDLVVSASSYVRDGTVKGLLVGSDQRSPAVPDVPTAAEAGLPDFRLEIWTGLYAPKGTSPEIVAKLERVMAEALSDPSVQKRLADLGARTPGQGEQGGAHMKGIVDSDISRWLDVFGNVKGQAAQ